MSAESGTPRCDAFEIGADGVRYVLQPRRGLPDWASFARQLERELAVANTLVGTMKVDLVKAGWELAAEKARADKARKLLMRMKPLLHPQWGMEIDEALRHGGANEAKP